MTIAAQTSLSLIGTLTIFMVLIGMLETTSLATSAQAATQYQGLFDVEARREVLKSAPELKTACLKEKVDPDWLKMEVIPGLGATEGYGSDRSAHTFSWAVMVLSARALAGETASEEGLKKLLLKWSAADGFEKTLKAHDAYYALKRTLLPTIVAYSIIRDGLEPAEVKQIGDWLDPLVRKVDQIFDGDVDINNHRYLADSVLMTWGAMIGDDDLYMKGRNRYETILREARSDGSLPLETRRGARALWYMRQSLSSMIIMAETARGRGDDLYSLTSSDNGTTKSIWTIAGFWINGMSNNVLMNEYAAANHIPGPSRDYLTQDMGFLQNRGNGRHYLAFMEALTGLPKGNLTLERARQLVMRDAADERPLIDEFGGGNGTCFWGQ